MSGLSGAFITICDNYVDKRGPRCREQGEWLVVHPGLAVPRVFELFPDGYRMELLTEISEPLSFEEVILGLQQIWSCKPEVRPEVNDFRKKILGLQERFHSLLGSRCIEISRAMICALDSDCYGLTHGDPTYENMLLRTEQIIFCDPLPATSAIPDIIEVDLGKLLQSALGWEILVKEDKGPNWTCEDVLNYGDSEVIISWAIIHLLRALPYSTNHTAILGLIDAALDL